MKNVLLFMFVFIMGIVQCDAQLGKYYKTTHDTYEQAIVETDSSMIKVKYSDDTIWFYFKNGMCNEMYIHKRGVSDRDMIKWLDEDKDRTKSEKGDWWYFYIKADNSKAYHSIIEMWYDDGDTPYYYVHLNDVVDE